MRKRVWAGWLVVCGCALVLVHMHRNAKSVKETEEARAVEADNPRQRAPSVDQPGTHSLKQSQSGRSPGGICSGPGSQLTFEQNTRSDHDEGDQGVRTRLADRRAEVEASPTNCGATSGGGMESAEASKRLWEPEGAGIIDNATQEDSHKTSAHAYRSHRHPSSESTECLKLDPGLYALPQGLYNGVPRILHQTGKSWQALDSLQREFAQECMHMYSADGWKYCFWDDDTLDVWMKTQYPEFYSAWSEMTPIIRKIDTARSFLMHNFGGVYIDLDAECQLSIDPLIRALPSGSTAWFGGFPGA